MSGSRDRNLRGGHLHERLGQLLISGVAAIAPVPGPEDVGIDSLCTLLEPVKMVPGMKLAAQRALLPREACYVQFKSRESVFAKKLIYQPNELQWLHALT